MRGRRARTGLLVAAGLAVLLIETTRGSPEAMNIFVVPSRASFVVRESVELKVVFENEGDAPVSMPASTPFVLKGPSYPEGLRFERPIPDPKLPPPPPMPPMPPRSLAKEERVEKEVVLSRYGIDILEPGDYTFEARAGSASGVGKFSVVPLDLGRVTLGRDAAVWLHRGRERSILFEASFAPEEATGTTLVWDVVRRRAEVGLGADDAWRTATPGWFLWRDGKAIHAWTMGAEQPSLELEGPSAIVPALMLARMKDASGPPLPDPLDRDLEAFVLSRGGSSLSLVRFGSSARKPRIPPETKWTEKLKAPALGAAAVLATSGERHVALVSANDEGGLTVHEGASRDGTAAPSFRSVRIEKKELVPESAPLLWLDESGTAHACLLVTSLADAKDDPREVHLAEVAFPKDKDSPPPRLVSVGQVKGPPRAGALARLETAGRPSQIHVVVEDRDGVLSLAHATGPDLTLKAGARGTLELPPIRPLQIAPVSGNAFILAKDPKRGPVFASVK